MNKTHSRKQLNSNRDQQLFCHINCNHKHYKVETKT